MKKLLFLMLIATIGYSQTPQRIPKLITDSLVTKFIKMDSIAIPAKPRGDTVNIFGRGTLGVFIQYPDGTVHNLDSVGTGGGGTGGGSLDTIRQAFGIWATRTNDSVYTLAVDTTVIATWADLNAKDTVSASYWATKLRGDADSALIADSAKNMASQSWTTGQFNSHVNGNSHGLGDGLVYTDDGGQYFITIDSALVATQSDLTAKDSVRASNVSDTTKANFVHQNGDATIGKLGADSIETALVIGYSGLYLRGFENTTKIHLGESEINFEASSLNFNGGGGTASFLGGTRFQFFDATNGVPLAIYNSAANGRLVIVDSADSNPDTVFALSTGQTTTYGSSTITSGLNLGLATGADSATIFGNRVTSPFGIRIGRDANDLLNIYASNMIFRLGGANRVTLTETQFSPNSAGTLSLGSNSYEWNNGTFLGNVSTNVTPSGTSSAFWGDTLIGGTGSGGNLFLGSTSHATKGKTYLGANIVVDEANTRIGIGQAPAYKLEIVDAIASTNKTFLSLSPSAVNDGYGCSIDFRGATATTADRYVSRITGIREASGAKMALAFYTETGSALTEKMRIASDGKVSLSGASADSAFTTASTQGVHIGRGLKVDANVSVGKSVTITDDLTYYSRHGYMHKPSLTYTPDVTEDVAFKLVPGLTVDEADSMTVVADSIVIQTPGSYFLMWSFTVQGGSGEDYQWDIRLDDVAQKSFIITTTGANNYISGSTFNYFDALTRGKRISFAVTNLTNSNNPTIKSMGVYCKKEY